MSHTLSFKKITAIIMGNAIEWYDYFVYSFLSVYLAKIFFPSTNDLNSLLAITATFGVAFLMRPLGGIVLGVVADKYGRIRAMNWSIALMIIALTLISFAPTYNQVGIIAPLIILFARLIQGFSAGGECGISPVILFESAPPDKRGFYCSMHTFSQMIAVLASLIVGISLAKSLSASQIEDWGWRLPFLIGLVIIPIGVYIRQYLKDPILIVSPKVPSSLLYAVRHNIQNLFIVIGLVSGGSVAMYVLLSYMPTYVSMYLHLNVSDAYASTLMGVGLMIVLIPCFGWLSDKMGRKNLLLLSMVCCFIEIYPCFLWLNAAPSFQRLVIIQCIICFSLSIYYGAIQAAITELFSFNIRSTCLSLGVNVSVLLFGSFAQFFVTLLIKVFANPLAVTVYPLIGIGISLISAMFYQENKISEETSLQEKWINQPI
ncbi:MFS transporter [Legionella maioricensis]|uniref:MFS transporter n=1 Tax=Legionella maioricensis TaxID=2896528 RepID=A0A9X2D1Y3_9GAMM|nr:MFS transporter [Legionella maioricensis]MCL9684839.1 MFS transporter [Legionella maioricensis]MCL9688519.1 MFS transporter [Legionella maioricensis]